MAELHSVSAKRRTDPLFDGSPERCGRPPAALLFPTGISAEYSHASQAFGEILRPVNDPCLAVWEKEKWEERPDGIYPMLDYVYLQDNARSFGLITGGGREYEITGSDQDTIAFTVLSCTGMCGEDDLIRRPGRLSGIALPTPDSQMHGTIRQEFALALSAPGGCASASQLYHWPAVCWHQAERQEFFLNKKDVRTPVRASLLKLNGNVQISAVRRPRKRTPFWYGYSTHLRAPRNSPSVPAPAKKEILP